MTVRRAVDVARGRRLYQGARVRFLESRWDAAIVLVETDANSRAIITDAGWLLQRMVHRDDVRPMMFRLLRDGAEVEVEAPDGSVTVRYWKAHR